MANEIKDVIFGSQATPVASGNVEAGTYDLTFDSQTTGSLNYNDSAATIQTALEGLSSIGSGNVAVAATANGHTVDFQGTLANTNVGALTAGNITLKQKADTVSVSTITNGAAGVYEVHNVNLGGAITGQFDLFYLFPVYSMDLSGVQLCYDNKFGSGVFTVVDNGGGDFTATSNSYGAFENPSVGANSTDGSPTASTTTEGVAEQFQVVTVTLPDSPTEGNLNVTLDMSTSSDFAYNEASPASITGWTGGGSAGNWTYTRDTAASNVSVSGAEGSTPLRKDCGIEIVTTQEGSSAGYTIDLASGSYALSGQAAGLLLGRKIDIAQGSYTLTGQDVALSKGFTVALDSGGYTLSGQSVELTAQRTIAIETGSYTLTGQDLGLAKGFVIAIGQGSYGLTGQDVGLLFGRVIALEQGSYTLSGQAVELTKGFTITLDAATFALNGQAVGLTAQRILEISQGSYTLTGQDVGLARGYVLAIDQGSYALTGQDVSLLAGRSIGIDAGSYVLTGQGVVFAYAPIIVSYSGYALAQLAGRIGGIAYAEGRLGAAAQLAGRLGATEHADGRHGATGQRTGRMGAIE